MQALYHNVNLHTTTVYYSQFTVVEVDGAFKTHTKDCTGLERTISTSTELVVSRGELLMK